MHHCIICRLVIRSSQEHGTPPPSSWPPRDWRDKLMLPYVVYVARMQLCSSSHKLLMENFLR